MTENIKILQENIISIIAIFLAIMGFITTFNEKARGFLLRKKQTNKSVAEINKETALANEETLASVTKVINSVTENMSLAFEKLSAKEKENYECKNQILKLQNAVNSLKSKVDQNCNNNCLNL